jgi:hypothetical protein
MLGIKQFMLVTSDEDHLEKWSARNSKDFESLTSIRDKGGLDCDAWSGLPQRPHESKLNIPWNITIYVKTVSNSNSGYKAWNLLMAKW